MVTLKTWVVHIPQVGMILTRNPLFLKHTRMTLGQSMADDVNQSIMAKNSHGTMVALWKVIIKTIKSHTDWWYWKKGIPNHKRRPTANSGPGIARPLLTPDRAVR